MSTQIIAPLMTVADLAAMPDDDNSYEIIGGELLMSRAPAVEHQIVIGNIVRHVGNYLAANSLGLVIPTPGVIFTEYDAVIPDVIFISHQRRERLVSEGKIFGAPELVIEVVSPGAENERRDRVAKLQLYAKHGVREYWIADAWRCTLEVYRRDPNQMGALALIATLETGDVLTTPLFPNLDLQVSEIFAS